MRTKSLSIEVDTGKDRDVGPITNLARKTARGGMGAFAFSLFAMKKMNGEIFQSTVAVRAYWSSKDCRHVMTLTGPVGRQLGSGLPGFEAQKKIFACF